MRSVILAITAPQHRHADRPVEAKPTARAARRRFSLRG